MRILIISQNLDLFYKNEEATIGGAAVQTANWINGFKDKGYTVGILGLQNIDGKIFTLHGLEYVSAYDENKGLRIIRNIYYRLPAIFFAVKRFQPKIIYCDVPGWQSLIYAVVSKFLSICFIQRISNDIYADIRAKSKIGTFKYYLMRKGYRFANILLCQNDYQVAELRRQYNSEKILKLYNPFTQISENEISNTRKYVAWVGIFQYQKNLPALLKIVKANPNIKFKIAGKPYSRIDSETHEAIEILKKCTNTEFVGFLNRDKLSEFLSAAFFLLNTSRYEGFSNTYLEALSMGTPIITTRKTDPDGLIEANHLGFTFDNTDEIASNLSVINGINYEEFKISSAKHLTINHDPAIIVDKLMQYLNKSCSIEG